MPLTGQTLTLDGQLLTLAGHLRKTGSCVMKNRELCYEDWRVVLNG